jgi:type II secretory pathway pseudopilin PulG
MGEETFGLAEFAEMAAAGPVVAADLDEAAAPLYAQWVAGPLFRLSVLPEELSAYSSCLERYQQAAATESLAARQILVREAEQTAANGGTLAQLVAPGLSNFLESQNRFDAKRAAAGALLAATRQRLETGSLPDTLEKLVPTKLEAVPADSFLGEPLQKPLRLLQTTGEWTIYSVGPNGNDDGGPLPEGAEPTTNNDDIGLSMKR